MNSCPDRYTACPLDRSGKKECKYLDSDAQSRESVRLACLAHKERRDKARDEAWELESVANPGNPGVRKNTLRT